MAALLSPRLGDHRSLGASSGSVTGGTALARTQSMDHEESAPVPASTPRGTAVVGSTSSNSSSVIAITADDGAPPTCERCGKRPADRTTAISAEKRVATCSKCYAELSKLVDASLDFVLFPTRRKARSAIKTGLFSSLRRKSKPATPPPPTGASGALAASASTPARRSTASFNAAPATQSSAQQQPPRKASATPPPSSTRIGGVTAGADDERGELRRPPSLDELVRAPRRASNSDVSVPQRTLIVPTPSPSPSSSSTLVDAHSHAHAARASEEHSSTRDDDLTTDDDYASDSDPFDATMAPALSSAQARATVAPGKKAKGLFSSLIKRN
jgi:hypothetical protein